MWRHISREIDFREKYVLDVGCGYGDFLWRAYVAGAEKVWGMDKEKKFSCHNENIVFVNEDIEYFSTFGPSKAQPEPDVAFCFSVLPYIDDQVALLRQLSFIQECVVEFQYKPEPYCVRVQTDDEAEKLLSKHWAYVKNIGKTYVEERRVSRTLWYLTGGKHS